MRTYKVTGSAEAVVRRMVFLAWKACGGPSGMGFLQDRGPNVPEDQVWEIVYQRRDYPGGNDGIGRRNKLGEVYADYAAGRMMKVGFQWDEEAGTVSCRSGNKPGDWRADYQGFSRKYQDFDSLLAAAAIELKVQFEEVTPVGNN